MKKLNENLAVMIDCARLADEYNMENMLNNLRDDFQSLGADVRGNGTHMRIENLNASFADIDEILQQYNLDIDELMGDNILFIFGQKPGLHESQKSKHKSRKRRMNESYYDDYLEDDGDYYEWDERDDENMNIIKSGGRIPADAMFDDLDECDTVDEDVFDDDDALNDDLELSIFDIDEMDEDPFDVEGYDEYDDCIDDYDEDAEFVECVTESYNKRKGCCPPKKTKSNRLVNLYESYNKRPKAKKRKKESFVINESIFNNALKKVKDSNKKHKFSHLKSKLGEANYNNILNALKEGKSSLYTKKRINGKSIAEYSNKELYKILKEISEQIITLKKRAKSLNESVKKDKVKEELKLKKRLLNILDEELTYRLTLEKYLKEDEDTASTEETSTDTSNNNDNTDSDNAEDSDNTDPEKDEEVELARVIITVANQSAADDLKSELVNAGVPDEAIEFETDDEEEDIEEPESDDSESSDEESSDESTDDTESTDGTNESLHVNVFRRLLEDEETSDESTDDTESTDDATDDSSDESTDDKPVKVILVNTDYIETLAQVLNDVYGIEQDEFEEMIGGSIVSDDNDDTDDDNSDEESSDDDTASHGDEAIDNMSDDDLAQLFGESINK